MKATDHTAAAIARGEPPDDPDPDAARALLARDVAIDGAAAARLREESRRTRARVERRLSPRDTCWPTARPARPVRRPMRTTRPTPWTPGAT